MNNSKHLNKLYQFQSGRTEAPASTIPPVLQRFRKSVYLVQLSKSGKYASGKKVALNTLILRNVEAPSARLLNCKIFLQRCNILMYFEKLSCLRHICLTLIVALNTLIFGNVEAPGGQLKQGLPFFQTDIIQKILNSNYCFVKQFRRKYLKE